MNKPCARVIYSPVTSVDNFEGEQEISLHAVRAISKRGMLKKAIILNEIDKDIPARLCYRVKSQPARIFSIPPWYYFPINKIWLDYIASFFIGYGCDIFHIGHGGALVSLKKAKRNKMVTILERTNPHPEYQLQMMQEEYVLPGKGFKRPLRYFYNRWLKELKLADYLLLSSRFAYDSFMEYGFNPKKLILLPLGVDIDLFKPPIGKKEGEKFIVLFRCRICFKRGVQYLLKAWDILNLKLKDAELVLVGDYSVDEPFFAPYRKNKSIKFMGIVNDRDRLVDIYQRSSLFILPSIVNSEPLVTYQAMACGLPLIVTPNAGSMVRDNIDGFIVPIRDAEAIAQKILYLYQNRDILNKMGERACAYIREFTWERYERGLISIYETVSR
ncbi:MAG: glycosyltransferase family 4 protein [Nitrospinae bacterium]|nr:glycosyltransferase family 4 protein [Nitrospinota bacterium]